MKILILRGVSGSGKSTFAASLAGATICSSDAFMLDESGAYRFDHDRLRETHAKAFLRFRAALRRCDPLIVVDNLNLRRKWFVPYAMMGRASGYQVFQKTLRGGFQNVHGVPPERVAQMAAWYEEDPSLPEWR